MTQVREPYRYPYPYPQPLPLPLPPTPKTPKPHDNEKFVEIYQDVSTCKLL